MLGILLRNSTSNVSVLIVRVVFSFIMAPVFVKALGRYDFGLWEMVFAIVGYMGLLDIGMRPAVIRYVAKYNAVDDKKAMDELFSTSLIFNGVIGILALVILVLWAKYNPESLSAQSNDITKYILFLIIIGVQLLFQFPGYIAECFHIGFQRHFLINNVSIVNAVIGNLIVYYLLTHGYGLLTMALGSCISFTIKYSVFFILLFFEKYGGFRLSIKKFSLPMLKRLLVFGVKSFVLGLSSTIHGGLGNVLIGVFMGPASVPLYSIPYRLTTYVVEFISSASNVFMPMFSHLQSKKQNAELNQVYIVSSKLLVAIICPVIIGVILVGESFIFRWIGPEYSENCQLILIFLSVGTLMRMINPLFTGFMIGTGKVGFLAIIRSISTCIFACGILALIKPYGLEGVAFSFMMASVITAPYEIWYSSKKLSMNLLRVLLSIYFPVIIPNIIHFFFVKYLTTAIDPKTYFQICQVVLISGTAYFIMFIFLIFNKNEKKYLIQKIKRITGN